MCKIMEELRDESYAEGKFAALVKDGLLSIREASRRANMTEQKFEEELKRLK